MAENGKIKVCVGLSGGVDSSVAALLLKQQGYDVFAMFMQNWHDADSTLHGDCEWEEDRFVAEMVARKIGIPFYFVDLSNVYRERVVDYMFGEYEKGRTPNPDVLCNREIKFEAFAEVAKKYGADCVATGHYCRKIPAAVDANIQATGLQPGPQSPQVYDLAEGADPNKDQSYFLCQISHQQLQEAIFPIGDLTKPEVRRIAKEADLPSAEKKDSQGICFVGKVDLPTFLKQKLESKEGEIIEVYDAFYGEAYKEREAALKALLKPGATLEMTGSYAPEVKILTSDGEPLAPTPFDETKLAALTDEELEKLAEPMDYSPLKFETEVYRSGRHHIRKTRFKPNPWGAVIGTHEGAQFYTIGQRKGLAVGGHKESLFVIATDMDSNRIYVGEGHSHKGLYRHLLRIRPDEIHWLREDVRMDIGEIRRYRVRVRYRQPLQSATLIMRQSGLYILFDKPQRGLAPGQFAVWYDGDILRGSGPISR